MRSILGLVAAVNPFAVAVALWPRERSTPAIVAATIALAGAVVAGAAAEQVLDALDVSAGTFRVATAVVLGLVGAKWLIAGAARITDAADDGWGRVGVPLLFPVLFTPQLMMVSVSVGVDDGVGTVIGGAAAGLAAAAIGAVLAAKGPVIAWNTAARFVGAVAIAVALALAVDGVQTV